ncbi:hypothetical protein ABOM_006938 [Aspergillus bombycis]|uniref:Berberine/berberine-like domain-containing protein n=1 Tax=Aspergillus bombycis TaxID=109264 RepID=A0A1F7ZYC2_9EURO|nr:hypothetical protein ABOM_006938 [Aspergillus bombycis]OGM44466.1 hypothetical protein ABOM_006938 [Aspergillus bombycis]
MMASLPSVAAIVNGANLNPSNIPQVEVLFAQFASLSPAEKDNERGSFVDKVFPLFFGENAVVDGSSAYEAQRQVPWSSNCWLRPQVVLANAEIVNANAKENSDLFWALKGGGCNFGIVTKMEMETVPAKIWSQARVYAPSVTTVLLQAPMKHHEAIERDNKSSLIWIGNDQGIILVSCYCDPVDTLPAVFEPFDNIPFASQRLARGVYSTYELLGVIEGLAVPGHVCHDFRSMTSQPSLEVYEAAERVRVEQTDALSDVEGLRLSSIIQPISSIGIKQSQRVGGNPLGLEEVGQQWFLVMADWNNPVDGDRVRQAMRRIGDAAEATAKANGTYLPYQYCNYAARDQDPLASYGTENVARLKAVSSKYDPDGVFQTLQRGGWLLSRCSTE